MKYAHIKGQRTLPKPGLEGKCPACGSPLVPKCGDIRVWHWAHRGRRTCDPWWENETQWHRNWKNRFPEDWQESIHHADSGERHIADVRTEKGWVIEFQHSHIAVSERQAREGFYERMVWVVDGRRRKRDWSQFTRAIEHGGRVQLQPLVCKAWVEECALLKEWQNSTAHVFFDFGSDDLYVLLPGSTGGWATIMIAAKKDFVEHHKVGTYGYSERAPIGAHKRKPVAASPDKTRDQKVRLIPQTENFAQYVARTARARSRFRF